MQVFNGKFTFQKCKKRCKLNNASDTSKLQQKNSESSRQISHGFAINSMSENKHDPSILHVRKLLSNTKSCDQKGTLIESKIEEPALTCQGNFYENSDPVTSIVDVCQATASISDSATSVQLSYKVCGSASSIRKPVDSTPLDKFPIKTSIESRSSEGKPLALTFKCCSNINKINAGKDISVRPKVRSDEGRLKDESCNVLNSCTMFSNSSSLAPIPISAASVNPVSSPTGATFQKPSLFTFGNSKGWPSTTESSSKFKFTLAQGANSLQVSAYNEAKDERPEKPKSLDGEFSTMTLLASKSKTLNRAVSKPLTNFQGKAEMGPWDKITSIPLFSSGGCDMKAEYAGGCTVLSSGSRAEPISLSATSVNLVSSATEAAVSNPALFTFGDSKGFFSTPGNFTKFNFTQVQAVNKAKSEVKEKANGLDERFRTMTFLASNSKTLNCAVSKSLTNFQVKTDLGPGDKKSSASLLSSDSCDMKTQYPSPFLAACITVNTTVPSSSMMWSLPSVSESNIHENHKATESFSRTSLPNHDKSCSVHASSDEGFANNSLFTLPYNMSKTFKFCTTTANTSQSSSNCVCMFNAVQLNALGRETSFHFGPLNGNLVEKNGNVPGESTFLNDAKDLPSSQNVD